MTRRLGDEGDGATPRLWRCRAEWIPAYAGMTGRGAGMTVKGGARDDNGARNGRRAPAIRPRDGARCAPSPSHPRGHVIPAKAGTYWRRPPMRKREPTPSRRACGAPPSAVPSPAAFAASSPLIGRGGMRRLRASMGRDSRLHGNDGRRGGNDGMGPRCALRGFRFRGWGDGQRSRASVAAVCGGGGEAFADF